MSFDPEKITFFAKTDARGKQVPFGIKARDRQRHMYVVGKTGMGKSTLLENMAAQDIQNGEGMAFIDPHGSAAETLLDYVPEHRVNDVVYFAPFDLSNPVSFNVLEDVGPDKRHLVVSGLMSTFKKIWVDAWSARMEYILTNALLALIEYPDTTLLSVNRLFSDKAYRKQVVDYIKDPAVKAFWTEEFANYTDRFAAEALPAIQNKIGQFTGNPLIRNIIGQPHSSFDIRKIMDEKKILIMNLSKGLVGETNANLLGSMLTTRIYLAAMSRADLPVDQMRTMPNFYFYVDEFQSFANATFANILSEARKYHLNLVIAHQYIEQMEEDVRNAVFGNVGTTISFRVGPFDAEVLETVFSPRFLATDLVNLGFAQIYLTLMIDGIGSQPFSAITLPPVERPAMSCKGMVIAASRKNFAKTREEVDKIIVDLHVPVKVEPPPPKKAPLSNIPNNVPGKPTGNAPINRPTVRPNLPNQVGTPPATSGSTQRVTFNDGATREIKAPQRNGDINRPQPVREGQNNYRRSTDERPKEVKTEAYYNRRSTDEKTNAVRVEAEVKPKPIIVKRSPEELRAILARMANSEKGGADKASVGTVEEKPRVLQIKKEMPAERSPLKDALADVLRRVEVTSTTSRSPVAVSDNKQQQDSLARERAELERLSAEAEAAFDNLNTKPTVAPIVHDDPLAPKKIEKLFKSSGTHRSPFAS